MSSPEGPAAPWVLRDVDLISAASMDSNMTGWQSGGDPLMIVALTALGCLEIRTSFTVVRLGGVPTLSLR